MKLLDVVKTIGKGIIGSTPAGAAVMGAINAVTGKKTVTPDMSGDDVHQAIEDLPDDQRMKVLDLEGLEVQENTRVVQLLAEVDKTGNSTRPTIALLSFFVCALVVLGVAMFSAS